MGHLSLYSFKSWIWRFHHTAWACELTQIFRKSQSCYSRGFWDIWSINTGSNVTLCPTRGPTLHQRRYRSRPVTMGFTGDVTTPKFADMVEDWKDGHSFSVSLKAILYEDRVSPSGESRTLCDSACLVPRWHLILPFPNVSANGQGQQLRSERGWRPESQMGHASR